MFCFNRGGWSWSWRFFFSHGLAWICFVRGLTSSHASSHLSLTVGSSLIIDCMWWTDCWLAFIDPSCACSHICDLILTRIFTCVGNHAISPCLPLLVYLLYIQRHSPLTKFGQLYWSVCVARSSCEWALSAMAQQALHHSLSQVSSLGLILRSLLKLRPRYSRNRRTIHWAASDKIPAGHILSVSCEKTSLCSLTMMMSQLSWGPHYSVTCI